MTCRYWEPVYKNSALCRKTDFIDRCKCGGDQSKCDFPEKPKKVVEEPKLGEWISVKDRLPEDPRFVLVYVKHPERSPFPAWSCIMTDMWLGDRWAENADEEVHEVTHWMPLPEPPKEE